MSASPGSSAGCPTVAVDLRALVGARSAGIGVYTRELLTALSRLAAVSGEPGLRYRGTAHRPLHDPAPLLDAGVAIAPPGLPPWVPAALPLGVIWQQLRLPAQLLTGGADLLFSPLLTLPLACPLPAVVTVHDMTVFLHPEVHRAKTRWSLVPFLGPSVRRARRVVTISDSGRRDLAARYPQVAERTVVVYPGVAERFRPAGDDARRRVRAELGAPQGYLLYVGTLEPRKNVGCLLDAWELLRQRLGDAGETCPPLLLAGSYGWRSRATEERIAALAPGVRRLDRLPEDRLIEVYQGALAFAYPSLYEGFGLPPLEAMACGVPCVVSDRSSLPEVVGAAGPERETEPAGLMIDPGSPADLAAALHRLVTDRPSAAHLAERGLARARRFTWRRCAERMREIFLEVLAGEALASSGTASRRRISR